MANYPYESVVSAAEAGMDGAKLEQVAQIFREQQVSGAFPGGQLVVRRRGKVALNIACGMARGWRADSGNSPLPVQMTTPFPVFSTGKPMAAVVIALLEASGKLDVHRPVASILPEFGSLGREPITLIDVLTHRAGIILPQLIDKSELLADREAVWQELLATRPTYPRGTFAYMPVEYGVILDTVVHRISGRSIGKIFHDELAVPLGLPNISYGLDNRALEDLAWSYWLGGTRLMVAGMNVADNFEAKNNNLAVFRAGNPAFSMVADAANLAAFYEFLVNGGRTRSGQSLIAEPLLRTYTSKQVSGWNKSVNTYLSLGRGFILGTAPPSFYGWWRTGRCFGHPGMFSSVAFGDYATGLSVAIVTNGNRGISDFFRRTVALTHRLRMACVD